ncbi:MAG: ankyrin repeat domain-containing protein [bacterium]
MDGTPKGLWAETALAPGRYWEEEGRVERAVNVNKSLIWKVPEGEDTEEARRRLRALEKLSGPEQQRKDVMAEAERLFGAIEQGDRERVREMVEEDPTLLRERNASGATPVLHALYHRKQGLVDVLLEPGVPLDIFEAAALGHTDRVKGLLEEDPLLRDQRSLDGFTPLHLAAFFDRRDTAKLLIQEGADIEAEAHNPTSVRPLHSAVAGGAMEVVMMLLARGADPNSRQQRGFTPLMGAAAGGHEPMVRLLVASGADPSLQGEDGRDAARVARDYGHGRLADMLSG